MQGIEVDEMRYVDEKEVSRITGLAIQTLRNHRFRGEGIPYHKVGRSVRYLMKDIYDFMGAKRINTDG